LKVEHILFPAFHATDVEALVPGLFKGDSAHELAEIVQTMLDPPKARVGLISR
jgi:hypothetical protein